MARRRKNETFNSLTSFRHLFDDEDRYASREAMYDEDEPEYDDGWYDWQTGLRFDEEGFYATITSWFKNDDEEMMTYTIYDAQDQEHGAADWSDPDLDKMKYYALQELRSLIRAFKKMFSHNTKWHTDEGRIWTRFYKGMLLELELSPNEEDMFKDGGVFYSNWFVKVISSEGLHEMYAEEVYASSLRESEQFAEELADQEV